ncbi:HDOD domain-containing protein [Xanthomonas sp. AmX2]|uniref:HDOD domain-containing protein n=1 Tax=Xanthomonas sp. TaxID=29446 RepID=UPI001980E841|nr:HDOD domain-containing protein [Xanthomonas sp.]MBN6148792.1 HDOD domain-containing protein [Xanthomonas sp.]
MRVLFVDDEKQVLAGIERTLFMADRDWDVAFAGSGAEALTTLAGAPADVVVSDMRMPLMDGAELLRRVRERWPRTIRIILSGHTEQEAALRSLDVAHQFLAKPCDGDALIEAIDRAVALQVLLADPAVQAVAGRIGGLPSAPRMFERLNRLLGDCNCGVAQIAEVVEGDPALAAKVLQLANCAFFGNGHRVNDIKDAVGRIGISLLRTLVLASEVFHSDGGDSADAIRTNAVRASRLAAAIAKGYASEDIVVTAALLANIGRLLPDIDRLCRDADPDSSGFPSHAEIGAYLLGVWGLPGAIVEAVAHHHCPGRVEHRQFDAVGVVHVAVALARGEAPDADYLQAMGVAAELPQWQAACARIREAEQIP